MTNKEFFSGEAVKFLPTFQMDNSSSWILTVGKQSTNSKH